MHSLCIKMMPEVAFLSKLVKMTWSHMTTVIGFKLVWWTQPHTYAQ